MFNVTGKGIICKDPELRYTVKNTTPVCNAVAVNNEEFNGTTTGHFTNLVLWGERAEDFSKEVKKGTLIEITEGILKHPVAEKDGKKLYKTEVTVLEWEVIQHFEPKSKKNPIKRKRNPGIVQRKII